MVGVGMTSSLGGSVAGRRRLDVVTCDVAITDADRRDMMPRFPIVVSGRDTCTPHCISINEGVASIGCARNDDQWPPEPFSWHRHRQIVVVLASVCIKIK